MVYKYSVCFGFLDGHEVMRTTVITKQDEMELEPFNLQNIKTTVCAQRKGKIIRGSTHRTRDTSLQD